MKRSFKVYGQARVALGRRWTKTSSRGDKGRKSCLYPRRYFPREIWKRKEERVRRERRRRRCRRFEGTPRYSVKRKRKGEKGIFQIFVSLFFFWSKLTASKKETSFSSFSLSSSKKEEEEERRSLFAKRKQVPRKTRASRLITRRIPSNVWETGIKLARTSCRLPSPFNNLTNSICLLSITKHALQIYLLSSSEIVATLSPWTLRW